MPSITRKAAVGCVGFATLTTVFSMMVSACGDRSGERLSKTQIVLTPDWLGDAAVVSSLKTPQAMFLTSPTVTADFGCFGVKVTGPGIVPSKMTSDCTILESIHWGAPGHQVGPFKNGDVVEMELTSGARRKFDIYGLFPMNADCNSGIAGETDVGGYFLGTTTVDLAGDSTVAIPISYAAASPRVLSCTYSEGTVIVSGPSPTPSASPSVSPSPSPSASPSPNPVVVQPIVLVAGQDGNTLFARNAPSISQDCFSATIVTLSYSLFFGTSVLPFTTTSLLNNFATANDTGFFPFKCNSTISTIDKLVLGFQFNVSTVDLSQHPVAKFGVGLKAGLLSNGSCNSLSDTLSAWINQTVALSVWTPPAGGNVGLWQGVGSSDGVLSSDNGDGLNYTGTVNNPVQFLGPAIIYSVDGFIGVRVIVTTGQSGPYCVLLDSAVLTLHPALTPP
ncbi:hypothetical protein WDW86_14520 [Bdellovibrionota bacterium FG-2]